MYSLIFKSDNVGKNLYKQLSCVYDGNLNVNDK